MDFSSKFDPRPSTDIPFSAELVESIVSYLGCGEVDSVSKLDGGFSSANYLIEMQDGFQCVARLAADGERLQKEADILNLVSAREPHIPIPNVLHFLEKQSETAPACCLVSFCAGEPLDKVEDTLTDDECIDVCTELAGYASAIHRIEFEKNGFFTAGPSVGLEFPSYVEGTVAYLALCIENSTFLSRVGGSRAEELRALLHREELHLPPNTQCLTHGDFNQKNVLVLRNDEGKMGVAALLDWEFALSGSGIMDIGNLLRFEGESKAVDGEIFANAYLVAGGHLAPNWRAQAAFADILPQCNFLMEEVERPTTIRTALGVIDRYLAFLKS